VREVWPQRPRRHHLLKLHLEISDGCVPSTQHLHQSEPQPLHVVELLLLGRNLLLQHPHDALPLRAAAC
jgi:hypothetical protein